MYVLFCFVVLLLFAMTGFHRGWKVSALHLASTFFSLWVAAQFYQPLSQYFRLFIPFPRTAAFDTHFAMNFDHQEMRFNLVIVFLLLVLIVKALMYLAIASFNRLFTLHQFGWFNRMIGACFACVSGIILLHFVCYLTALYPNTVLQQALAHSQVGQGMVTHIPFLSDFTLNLK